jgi:hypothetical protein
MMALDVEAAAAGLATTGGRPPTFFTFSQREKTAKKR